MNEVKYAGFWIRLVADIVDSILLDVSTCLVALMGLGLTYWGKVIFFSGLIESNDFLNSVNPFILQFILIGIRGFLSLGYFTWATYRYGTTLGKRLFHIQVVSVIDHSPVSLKQSLVRCLGYIVSYIPLGAGFLMVLFQPKKRALHDLIAGTVSIIRLKTVE
jgi:uncharacterized RDD family membrane protein YckC